MTGTNNIDHLKLNDDSKLLDLMLTDSKTQSDLYRPGPYWKNKTKNTSNEIKRYGLTNFRGSTNLIGLSYTDNLYIDIRNAFNHGFRKIFRWLSKTYPLTKIYDSQVSWTKSYANENIILTQEILNLKQKTKHLLNKYTVPYSLLGNCLRKAKIDGEDYSTHYLNLLEQHDNIASHINFNNIHSIFEIGGGFGTNIHLLLENYPNIKKVLYLDIPPNLYIGTQYLKSFYGKSVFDYRDLKDFKSIKFSTNDHLEIFCIAPWQIEHFESTVDIFMNSHSFVEMPNNIVENYIYQFCRFHDSINTAIALTTYDGFDLDTTSHPTELTTHFKDRKFNHFEADTLINSSRNNLYFISPGKWSL